MHSETFRFWPFEVVLPPQQRSAFQTALISLMESVHASGHKAYVNNLESLLGFGDSQRRRVEFIHRGRTRYWEPLLNDHQHYIRLGPFFALPEHTCVVFNGIEDVATFTMRWLNGDSLHRALRDLSVYDRLAPQTALQLEE